MRTTFPGRKLTIVLVLIGLFAVQLACGLTSNSDTASGNQAEPQQSKADGKGDKGDSQESDEAKGDTAGQEGNASTAGDQGESVVEPEFGSDTVPCPPKGGYLYLAFDHTLTVNYMETSITHMLHEGWLTLQIVDDEGTIASADSPSLTYTMEGVMSAECSLNAEGKMVPSAHGSCQDGVVYLFINENWQALNGEMQCVDDDGDTYIMPFDVPPMGLQQHSGPNGEGEIFYLTDSSEGYSSMRPFVEGDGYHTWTLYTDISVVPIVP